MSLCRNHISMDVAVHCRFFAFRVSRLLAFGNKMLLHFWKFRSDVACHQTILKGLICFMTSGQWLSLLSPFSSQNDQLLSFNIVDMFELLYS